MKTHIRIRARIAALAAALALSVTALAAPAFAVDPEPIATSTGSSTSVSGPSSVSFDKYIVLDQTAKVPNATINFSVTGSDNGIGGAVVKGTGTPQASTATFTAGQMTYTSAQNGDTITLDSGKAYASSSFTVDFSSISYTAPGTYRYALTETDPSVPGISSDSNTYYIDVYVTVDNTNGNLTAAVYGLANSDRNAKVTGLVNNYTSAGLSVTKDVTGNQGDRNKEFEFTITLTGTEGAALTQGNTYPISVTGGTATTTNPTEIEVRNDGGLKAEAKVYLKDNMTATVQGLPAGITYQIVEKDYSGEGYTTGYQINDETAVSSSRDTGTKQTTDSATTVKFTNNREGVVPTGILLDVAPILRWW